MPGKHPPGKGFSCEEYLLVKMVRVVGNVYPPAATFPTEFREREMLPDVIEERLVVCLAAHVNICRHAFEVVAVSHSANCGSLN